MVDHYLAVSMGTATSETEYELRYLLVLTDPTLGLRLVNDCSMFSPRQVFQEPAVVSVFEITSPRRYETLSPSPHELIESDLGLMREECSFFGESFLEYEGEVVGQRWPILIETSEGGPDIAEFSSGWNNLILRATGPQLANRLVDIAGHCLATYHILRALDDLATELARLLLGGDRTSTEIQRSVDEWAERREAVLAAQILADPRRLPYWGCELKLYESINDEWGLDELSATVHRSMGLLSQTVSDRTLRLSAAQNAASAKATRRAAVGLLLLTVISGVSALTTLIEFGVSGNEPRAMAWRVAIAVLLLAATVLLIIVNRRALRAHAATGPDPGGGQ